MWYNVLMVRSIHKLNILFTALFIASAISLPVSAADGVSVDWGVKIGETLSVSVTTPDEWAKGDVDVANGSELLRNKVILNVASNNIAGFSASMASKTTTDLVNKQVLTATIQTLGATATAGAFPVNAWGYSLDDTETGLTTANYNAMQTSLIALENRTEPANISKDIYFGARADATKEAGTYANTVVFTVVSGVDTTEPDNPGTGDDDNQGGEITTPDNNGTPSRAPVRRPNNVVADTDEEDNTTNGNISNSYADPQGVTKTNLGTGTPLATGLAVTAGVAATAGFIFFIIAKRKKDEEEDEEDNLQ